MIETVIMVLIWLCLLALAFFLIEWVLSQLGIAIPGQVIMILKVILVLVAIYIIVVNVLPRMGNPFRMGNAVDIHTLVS